MTITWYGHSCYRIETSEGSAVLDPYAPGSVPGLSLPALTADLQPWASRPRLCRRRAPEREEAGLHGQKAPQLP